MTIDKIKTKILLYVAQTGRYPSKILLNSFQRTTIKEYQDDKNIIFSIPIVEEKGKIRLRK